MSSNWATASLHVVANNARGDCNSSGAVEAADFPATVLEIFDADVDILWYNIFAMGFKGSPRGCDSNGSENGLLGNQPSVQASDLVCTVRIYFGFNCPAGVMQAAATRERAVLSVGAVLPAEAGSTLAMPVVLQSRGHSVAAMAFALEYDPTLFNFDATDADGDGVPDAVSIQLPSAIARMVLVEDGRIQIALFGTSLPLPVLGDGVIATVHLQAVEGAAATAEAVSLNNVSLGDDQGQPIDVDTAGSTVTIGDGAAGIFLPLIVR